MLQFKRLACALASVLFILLSSRRSNEMDCIALCVHTKEEEKKDTANNDQERLYFLRFTSFIEIIVPIRCRSGQCVYSIFDMHNHIKTVVMYGFDSFSIAHSTLHKETQSANVFPSILI